MWMVLGEEERVPMLSQKLVNDRNKLAVNVDVSQFKPEELKVNIDGRTVWIEGHHSEKSDRHGTIERSFKRSYLLPEDCKLENLQSHLSTDGHLCLEAPKIEAIENWRPVGVESHYVTPTDYISVDDR